MSFGVYNSHVCNNLIQGFSTTATAGSTTTLTSASNNIQYFTGTLNQSLLLPNPSTLINGFGFTVKNNSTGLITVDTPLTTVVAGGQSLTVAPFTLNVTSTASWGAMTSGTISVPTTVSSPQSVTFTGKTATSFTGCVAGGSFTSAAGTVSGTTTVVAIGSGLETEVSCVDTTAATGVGGWFIKFNAVMLYPALIIPNNYGAAQKGVPIGGLYRSTVNSPASSSTFSITSSFVAAGTTLTVTATSGFITPGMFLSGGSVSSGTQIVAQLTGGAGSTGTYQVDQSQLISVAPSAVVYNPISDGDQLYVRTI